MKKILITPRSLTKNGDPDLDLLTGKDMSSYSLHPGKCRKKES